MNRLTAATRGGERKEYQYDSVGNRIAEALAGQSIMHSYNARNQLIRSDDGEGVTNYNYDRRGNLTEVLRGGALEASYTFGATNMLEKAFSAARGEATYAYDGLRNRVKRLERDVQAKLDPCAEMRYVLDMTRPYDNLLMTHRTFCIINARQPRKRPRHKPSVPFPTFKLKATRFAGG